VRFCEWKGLPIHAWHIGDEHIHLFITIPPTYSVSYAVAIVKGKSSAWLKKQTKKFPKGTLWNRGYFIFTVGITQKFSWFPLSETTGYENTFSSQEFESVSLQQEELVRCKPDFSYLRMFGFISRIFFVKDRLEYGSV